MSAHVEQSSVLTGRSVALLASFAVPMLFLYGLARNIGLNDLLPEQPMKFRFIDPEPTPVPDIVDRFKVELPQGTERTRIVVNQPQVPFAEDDPVETRTGDPASNPGGGSGGGAVVAPIPPTPLNHIALRPSDDYYPSHSIRMAEQGITEIRICVNAAGSLQGLPAVTASSGHKRLDAAAVTWAREALRFEPATENGAAVAACKGFRVNFRLR